MMLTDLHGLERIMDCGEVSAEIFIVGIVVGVIIGMIVYYVLKDVPDA